MDEMKINRFSKVNGYYIEKIYGQERLAYAISETEDFYDMIGFMERDGYKGSVILFYDYETGEVYQPFSKKENVMYGKPIYSEGYYYFLQGSFIKEPKMKFVKETEHEESDNGSNVFKNRSEGSDCKSVKSDCKSDCKSEVLDYKSEELNDIHDGIKNGLDNKNENTKSNRNLNPEGTITLYQYRPGENPNRITTLSAQEVELYNLMLMGNGIHITSQNSVFECYYPEQIRIPLEPNESVDMIAEDRIYINSWIEEGWDMENDCATKDYQYYNKMIIKDFNGNKISEETGCLQQATDGSWWIS